MSSSTEISTQYFCRSRQLCIYTIYLNSKRRLVLTYSFIFFLFLDCIYCIYKCTSESFPSYINKLG